MTAPGSQPPQQGAQPRPEPGAQPRLETVARPRPEDGPLDIALVVVSGPLEGRRLPLHAGRLRLGRTPGNDVVVPNPTVSSNHATLDVVLGGGGLSILVSDAGSTNGTLVDGLRLDAPARIGVGNTVTFGAVECVVDVRVTASADAWELAALVEPPAARKRRTVLVAHDPADRSYADVIATYLQRAGHLVWIDRSPSGDGWRGRLFDTVWSCDGTVFVVSPAAVGSDRVRREVHLSASQRTVVIPALVGTTELPDDLGYYVSANPPVDLRSEPAEGLRALGSAVDALPRKRFAQPWRTVRRLALLLVLLALAFLAYRIIF